MYQKIKNKMAYVSVKGKIKVAVTCLIVALTIVSVIGSTAIISLKNNVESYQRVEIENQAITDCRINLNNIARYLREMVIEEGNTDPVHYIEMIDNLKIGIDAQLVVLSESEYVDRAILDAYKAEIQNWYQIGERITNAVKSEDNSGAAKIIREECNAALKDLIVRVDVVSEQITAEMNRVSKLSNIIYYLSLANNALFLLLGILFGVFLSKKLMEDISNPVEAIEKAAQDMESGVLSINLDFHSHDEMGILASSLRHAAAKLSAYIDDISHAMAAFSKGHFDVEPKTEWTGDFRQIYESVYDFEVNMSRIVTEIYIVAEQVDKLAAEVAGSAGILAEGAIDQATIIEELASSIEGISTEIVNNAKNADGISKEVENVSREIIGSNQKMQEMVNSMKEINEASAKISTMISAINDIASQTNLLALNASIEAARAGEAGRGFAVVADQVSLLAAQSANAAKESRVLIEASVEAVAKGLVIADETAKQLISAVNNSKIITGEVNNVAETLRVQAAAFEQINSGVENISNVCQNNASVSQECAATSEEMNKQANNLESLLRSFTVLKL